MIVLVKFETDWKMYAEITKYLLQASEQLSFHQFSNKIWSNENEMK